MAAAAAAGIEMMFSTYARLYGLLLVGRVRWHSRASQLLQRMVGDKNGRLNGSMRYFRYATIWVPTRPSCHIVFLSVAHFWYVYMSIACTYYIGGALSSDFSKSLLNRRKFERNLVLLLY